MGEVNVLLSLRSQNGDSKQPTTPATCVIHPVVHLRSATREAYKHTLMHAFSYRNFHGRLYTYQQLHLRNLVRTYLVFLAELPQFPPKQSIFERTKGKTPNWSVHFIDQSLRQRQPGSQTSELSTSHHCLFIERDLQKYKQQPYSLLLCCILISLVVH